jgi:hypothetical protein
MASTECKKDFCRHYKKAMKICKDHCVHSNQIQKFTLPLDLNDAFHTEKHPITSIQISVTPEGTNVCEWIGTCSLSYVGKLMLSNGIEAIMGRDLNGQTFIMDSTCVLSYECEE